MHSTIPGAKVQTMPNIPYFSLGRHSFEKNAGYKSTVHALAELIDNSVEADATEVTVVLMVGRDGRLLKIAVGDNGKGMAPDVLQRAICEKSGTHLDRQSGASTGRRKFGKYGVGLPKASISQCNKFRVWSWKQSDYKTAVCTGIDIEDEQWIEAGAQISEPAPEPAPEEWIDVTGLRTAPSGTLVLWERLDGLTWARARWGENSGLIPNMEFSVGRAYRYLLFGPKPEIRIQIRVVDEAFRQVEPPVDIGPNDPLYCMPGAKVPRLATDGDATWPTRDPLFDDLTGSRNELIGGVPTKSGSKKKVSWREAAFTETLRDTGLDAGRLPHGKHAARMLACPYLRRT